MKDIKILIIPDIHGRDFWREPVQTTLNENIDAKIIFLGDYVDPYPFEFEKDFDCQEYAFENLPDFINLKKEHPNNIILLIGNHDCGYAIGRNICQSRIDYIRENAICEIFKDNWNLFQIAYKEKINNIEFVFSHAGFSTNFIDLYVKPLVKTVNKNNVVDIFNNAWLTKDFRFLNILGVYDYYRGMSVVEWASPIWADIRKMSELTEENTIGDFQIVGHTQIETTGIPIIFNYIGDFDCRECFYIDSEGKIHNYLTDEIIK